MSLGPQGQRRLIEQAQAVLNANWTGQFTKPAFKLYPHQWSWDAAFIAIGYAHYDQARAEQELRSLFRGRWANGLLPHIVFHHESPDYFPGPELWDTQRSPHAPKDVKTSGIVQPPNHALAARHIYEHAQDRDRAKAFLEELYPKLRAWHDFLYRERDPEGEGLVVLYHPWGSGMDNSPLWDEPLRRIPVDLNAPALPVKRVDDRLVDPADRPTDEDYYRYLYLVKLFRDCNYEEACIRERCPFQVQDVLFNALLVASERALARIADVLGRKDASFHEERAEKTARALDEKLWDEEHKIYVDFDLVSGKPIDVHVAAGFTPLFAGIPSPERARAMCDYLNSRCFCHIDGECFAVPSFDRGAPGFSKRRYWRGPVWLNINWLLYKGLRRYGFHDYAAWVRRSIVELPQRYGFYEYYDPEAGRGHGAEGFSWTAALLLDVLYESEAEAQNEQREFTQHQQQEQE